VSPVSSVCYSSLCLLWLNSSMIALLQARRSIRKYKSDQLDAQTIATLKEAILRAPSSRGINPWEFIFVDDPGLLASLSKAKEHGSEFLDQAALGVVVCGDETKSDVWVEDCSIAAIILQFVTQSLGLGTCWIQIRNRMHNKSTTSEQYVQKVLNLPPHIKVESIISLGYPAETKKPHPKSSLAYEKIHLNTYK
jgi:nitroreductase